MDYMSLCDEAYEIAYIEDAMFYVHVQSNQSDSAFLFGHEFELNNGNHFEKECMCVEYLNGYLTGPFSSPGEKYQGSC